MKNCTLQGMKPVAFSPHPKNSAEENELPLPPVLGLAGWVAISRADLVLLEHKASAWDQLGMAKKHCGEAAKLFGNLAMRSVLKTQY